MPRIRERARAKVNLTLTVHGRRGDGYHELESLITFADIGDAVTLDPDAEGGLAVEGPFAPDIAGENLLARALAMLRDADPALRLGAVRLEKNLPVAAGLGGGSADAAALLRAVRRANAERASRVPWLEIAARLGADVPVCFADRPALVWGRGEHTAPLPSLPPVDGAVLVNPRVPLATAGVFAALGSGPAPPAARAPVVPQLVDLPGLLDYMQSRGNHLEPAAIGLLPQVAEIKSLVGMQDDCRYVAMSGSGPTCFALFSSPASARRAAAALAAARPHWWVACTSLAGT